MDDNYDLPIYDERDLDMEEEWAMEDNQDKQEEAYSEFPSLQQKESLFSLFLRVINMNDSSKVANLSKTELGLLDISVRDCQRIALVARRLGRNGFAQFFGKQAEIILATSCSKEGFLPNLFVSQHKFSTKSKVDRSDNLPQNNAKKKGFLGRKK